MRACDGGAMPQPNLQTERLVLVPLDDSHLELEVELDSDPEVLRYLFGRARSRDEVVESHARRMGLGTKVDGLGYWIAFDAKDEEFVGLMMLPPAHGPDQPDDPTVADLGYRLLAKYWRQGLGSEASRVLLRYAFETVGLNRVIAQTMAVNAGSRGVMKAVGMRHTRTYFPDWGDDALPDADQGEVEYEITAEMWREQLGSR
jgi:RimJ/RimL family protein N-acetyltransferase